MSHTPATPDPQAAGLLSLERLAQIRAAADEFARLWPAQDRTWWADYTIQDERAALLAHIDAQAQWFAARDKELCEAFDARNAEVAAVLRGLLSEAGEQEDVEEAPQLALTLGEWKRYNTIIHNAARALGLTL